MNLRQFCCAASLAVVCASSYATEKMYGVVTAGYADADYSEIGVENVSYKLALGHELSRQWYIEAGYQQLFDGASLSVTAQTTNSPAYSPEVM